MQFPQPPQLFWGEPSHQQWFPSPISVPNYMPYWQSGPPSAQPPQQGEPTRVAYTPSTSSQTQSSSEESAEDAIDPYLSEDEFRDPREGQDEGELTIPPAQGEPSVVEAQRQSFTSGQNTVRLLNAVTAKPLANNQRRALYPHPACDAAHTPKLDNDMSQIIPEAARKRDRAISRTQQFYMDSLSPLVVLYDQLDRGNALSVEDIKAHIKVAISLIGNATAHVNTERRKAVMANMNEHVCPMAQGEFPDRGPALFGRDFANKAKAMADNIRALKAVGPKRKHFFPSSGGPAKRSRFSQQPPGHRANRGQPPYMQSAGSILTRLGGPRSRGPRQPLFHQRSHSKTQTNPQK